MKSSILRTLAASVLILAAARAPAAELIQNGSFEAGSTDTYDFSSGLAHWTVNGRVDAFKVSNYGLGCCSWYTPGYPAAYGLKAAEFGAANLQGGTISQTFGTVAGTLYQLSFLYGAFGSIEVQQQLGVMVSDALTNTMFQNPTYGVRGTGNVAFMMNNGGITFHAMSALTKLTFYDAGDPSATINNDLILDKVSVLGAAAPVAPVPEPSTYMLMLSGLGVVAFVSRRRKPSQSASV